MKNNFQQKGFTLVEMVVATGIFMVITTVATGIFVLNHRTQQRTASRQDLQTEVSFALEKIVNAVRFGTIDYPSLSGMIPAGSLFLRDTDGNPISFQKKQGVGCEHDMGTCIVLGVDLSADGLLEPNEFTYLTDENISVSELSFYITPQQNPFHVVSGIYSANTQPQVTVVIRAQNITVKPQDREDLVLQTTVVTRKYER